MTGGEKEIGSEHWESGLTPLRAKPNNNNIDQINASDLDHSNASSHS